MRINKGFLFPAVIGLFLLAGSCEAPSAYTELFETVGDGSYVSPRAVAIDASSLENQLSGLDSDWYRDAAFYHIWVKAFSDSDGDGCGDIPGITDKLGYIQDTLGCDAIWLSPIFECSYKGKSAGDNMHGYDTTDYYAVNSYFGTEADVEALLAAAHEREMKVIFDFVPNHTSTSHPWFSESAAKIGSKSSWYLWNDEKLSWAPMGSSGTWYLSSLRGQYYYAPFWDQMPDLNFRNVEVREEMTNVARYWLNKGFDGLRIDAVRYLIENESQWTETAQTHQWFQELRANVVDAYGSLGHPKFMVGEAWINGNRAALNSYYGSSGSPEFQMLFDFDFAGAVGNAVTGGSKSVFTSTAFAPSDIAGTAVATMLSNHDMLSSRPATRYASSDAQLRLATAISLLQPATPFIYYGNEIGMTGSNSADINLRQPFDWTAEGTQASGGTSLLALHHALLSARAAYADIRRGTVSMLSVSAGGVAAYRLSYTGDSGSSDIVCVLNLQPTNLGSFTVSETGAGGTAATVIGENAFSVSGDTLTVTGLGPYEFRVFAVGSGSSGAANLYPY